MMAQLLSEKESKPLKLIDTIQRKKDKKEPFFSLEFFPPKTFNGATNLMGIIGRVNEHCTPLFCGITWRPSHEPLSDKCQQEPSTLVVSVAAIDLYGQNIMIHIPSGNTSKSQVVEHLTRAKDFGIGSVLAVRGDESPEGDESKEDGFAYTVDLVKFIRSEFGDHFTLGVVGYLASDVQSYEEDLKHLKEQVDAGADLIITQMFFEVKAFFKFVEDCQQYGINVPIIPAIFPIQDFNSLRQLKRSARMDIPQWLLDILTPMKDNSAEVMNYGIKYAAQMCKELLDSGHVHGLHFYTLNREMSVSEILKKLGMYQENDEQDSVLRKFPWLPGPALARRGQMEDVRPIFWTARPRSYMIRTSNWDEFPNGRWGDSSAASFGELKDYHLVLLGTHESKESLLNMWGRELHSEGDVFEIFVCYLTGKENRYGYKVKELPWNQDELAPETLQFVDKLAHVNKHGILTINSQPNVNAVPSTDPVAGWGKPGGYIFQKAYLEFFTSKEIALYLYEILQDFPFVNYHILNFSGKEDETNANDYSSNAVTWGVFPGSEILQPTVVDPIAFQFWKDEAFALWKHQWGSIYPESSKSREIIDTIHDTYYLVNLVDNDYVAGNRLFDILHIVLKKLNKLG
ncbi:methylenetetrahydrofolate reductase (NADPH)-like isoform X1 [Acropora palmata]|uniref:methylenetetrahydrofolate reductase (NADPH)-like isoform X1 n=1 Tax=Acropora palmata TaxID=6131 RepID=UPI003D9FE265